MTALLFTLLLSAGSCGLYLLFARRWQILDTPNERSSHQRPTPHGGGAPLMLSFVAGLLLSGWMQSPWAPGFVMLAGIALFLTALGVADDLRGLSVRLRFGVYGVCCLVAAATLMQAQVVAHPLVGLLGVAGAAFALLWLLNLYNFMDGIDGIAALQCVLACVSAALLALAGGSGPAYPLYCLLLAAAQLGFLLFNWPSARLFMGDAGSVPTGFLLGGLALLGAVQGQLDPRCWLVLLAVFVTDASWTLGWRILSGQRFTQPHRSHAYQRLSRHWNSHLAVDMLVLAINAIWLFPMAWVVQIWPEHGLILVILAYLPLVLGMAKLRKLA